MGWKTKSLEH